MEDTVFPFYRLGIEGVTSPRILQNEVQPKVKDLTILELCFTKITKKKPQNQPISQGCLSKCNAFYMT